MQYKKEVWVITNKNRTLLAKGTPRNRKICDINDGNARILTYSSKSKAENAFTKFGFYTNTKEKWDESDLVAVKCNMIIEEIGEK